jgi:ATP-dependent helicase/nuclease subunit A
MQNSDANLQSFAESALSEQLLDRSLADRALKLVEGVQRSEIWLRAKSSPRRFVEVPFQQLLLSYKTPPGTPPTVVRGVIDLVFEECGGWILVDFKTDDSTGQDIALLIERYRPQIRLYVQSWQEITRQPVLKAGLYFATTGRFVDC